MPIARHPIGRVLLAALLLCLASPALAGSSITVFAAASLKNAMDQVATQYEAAHPAREVKVSYAGSATLARQIEAGAPADVYVSANEQWMDQLDDDGLIDRASRRNLLTNTLVVVTPRDSAASVNLAAPGQIAQALPEGAYLAMADTRSVPAGIYGRQALKSLGLWTALDGRIAQAEDVRAALALVARGESPLGIVYGSDAVAEKDVRVVARFDADSHDAIVYPAAVTKQANEPAARQFLTYLGSEPAGRVFTRWGFSLAAESS
ncbi:molybdate ABC transporter substrate-binding protein [uncultured Salinisphaera sp.]|uniref:molybdate ABC transporter substrate-binding protein n=1 Tax=uncultured Salinisphaera sp. TaxID=359372 RepID=UPI0032B30701|tara:strand:+ start:2987 stop:3778 length:792 start_codon:yes stop_codon:yes gene_type:complete